VPPAALAVAAVVVSAPSVAPSGAELVAGLRARDPRAARAAWSLLSPQVRYVLRRFRDAGADREDLAQEVFLRFFARIDELRNPQSLRAFLFGICIGVAQNDRRRARVRRLVELRPPGDLPDHPAATPAPEARELARRVYEVLARAQPEDRLFFLMRHVDEMEIAELAEATGVSVSTARRRLARATGHIHKRLRADPGLAELAAGPKPANVPVR